ncbi:tail fiber assembly protein [Enterobacter pseudoroggenkampii]|uniref:tail fiber assembly protein n=1 Tax=Enterobacter pseudoroggenkampii TaxID=2996112 RepID=UPI0025B1D4DF|nr:tail fiber assembly protein [Enterobacter pseudoroggenkampii]WJW93193.1 tail fiber assembly protein [Enterobacter pseudoroggenkampii]
MTQAILNEDKVATLAGNITVYNYDGETREYISSVIEYLAVGVGIPANSCIDPPCEKKEGFAICRTKDFSEWECLADHRDETVYSTKTGEAVVINVPGDYPEGTTTLPPFTQYDDWNGSEWITDNVAKHSADLLAAEQQKSILLMEAKTEISLWQTELQLGIISDKDKANLITWLNYIKKLQAVDPSVVPDINWPEKPRG